MMKSRLVMLILSLLCLGSTGLVRAADCCGTPWQAWNPYELSERRIPYFAEHPPVYYSYPVPRTYGYSPYAYPGTVMTPTLKVASPEPLEIPNPHVEPKAEEAPGPTAAARRPEPLIVVNPYVIQGPPVAVSR